MANEDLYGKEMHCVICTKTIDAESVKRRAVTCSIPCAELRKRMNRKRVDNRECRFCHKPSTPTRRKAFTRFARWERENPTLAYPETWQIIAAAGITEKDFSKAVVQAVKRDVGLDYSLASIGWETTKIRSVDDPLNTPELDKVLTILAAYAIEHPAPVKAEPIDEEASNAA